MPARRGGASLGTVTPGTLTRRLLLCVLLVGSLAALIAGCGSSSKPAYCKNRSELEKSVSSLSVTGGVSSLKTQAQTIAGQVKSLGSSAKSDFPTQTTAVDNAVSTLEKQVKALPSSPSAGQLASVAVAVKNTVSSVSAFVSATKSKCQ
jgi:hypothetical protein